MNAVKVRPPPSEVLRSLLHRVASAIESTPPLTARPGLVNEMCLLHFGLGVAIRTYVRPREPVKPLLWKTCSQQIRGQRSSLPQVRGLSEHQATRISKCDRMIDRNLSVVHVRTRWKVGAGARTSYLPHLYRYHYRHIM